MAFNFSKYKKHKAVLITFLAAYSNNISSGFFS